MLKLLSDFEIQMDHLISRRSQELVIVNKKTRTCKIEHLGVQVDHRVKLKESKKYHDLVIEIDKTMKHENDGDTKYNLYVRYSHQKVRTRTGERGNSRMSRDHPNNSIIIIGQNSEKSAEKFRGLLSLKLFLRPSPNAGEEKHSKK